MVTSIDNTSRDALYSLDSRLRRLEFLLAGTCEDPIGELQALETSGREHTIALRLSTLERELSRIVSKSQALKDILELHELFPELFKSSNTTGFPRYEPRTSEKAACIIAAAPEYQSTNSQLTSVVDHPVPPAAPLTSLIELFPRIQQAQLVHEAQEQQLFRLRARSIAMLEQWYLAGIDGANECFAEWDERLFSIDKKLRQSERSREDENVSF